MTDYQHIIDALPGGFEYDWEMRWPESHADALRRGAPENVGYADWKTYLTNGEGTWKLIPEVAQDARHAAAGYESDVFVSIRAALRLEVDAKDFLLNGRIEQAVSCLKKAAEKEMQWGDAGAYKHVLELCRNEMEMLKMNEDGSALIGTELGMQRHNTETRDPFDIGPDEKIAHRGEAGTITVDGKAKKIYFYAADGDYVIGLGQRELGALMDMIA